MAFLNDSLAPFHRVPSSESVAGFARNTHANKMATHDYLILHFLTTDLVR